LTFEEFIDREVSAGRICSDRFTRQKQAIVIHGHCYQKALTNTQAIDNTLCLPAIYTVSTIPSGCCGMAGSFGYEKEHYDLSMQIGELVLFPAIRETDSSVVVAASGTSCRHQVHDGTGRKALHPAEVLHAALKDDA
jgi:Fe-S oxidoreductase